MKKNEPKTPPAPPLAPTMADRMTSEIGGIAYLWQLSTRERDWARAEAMRHMSQEDILSGAGPNNYDWAAALVRVALREIVDRYDEDAVASQKQRTAGVRCLPYDAPIFDDEAVFPSGRVMQLAADIVATGTVTATAGNS